MTDSNVQRMHDYSDVWDRIQALEVRIKELQEENDNLRQHLQEKWGRDSYLGHIQSENTRLRAQIKEQCCQCGKS